MRAANAAPKTIDEYLAALPLEQRAALEKVRETIRAAAPEVQESISYRLPAFKYKGRPLIYIGAAKNHCALYAIDTETHKDALRGYDISKGTVRFSAERPPPKALVRKLLETRMAEIEAGASLYGRRKSGNG
jgi:uncharacterized protein YdhG (YjbR/CyaY superfamily)